ncbi:hypothetical protein GGR56DRAFT_66770 [Xylariaceae sp. FL0804]|nr:hypothetical protein GGR56DRAFT_66770 [Xylariaceae sp. FL0804]
MPATYRAYLLSCVCRSTAAPRTLFRFLRATCGRQTLADRVRASFDPLHCFFLFFFFFPLFLRLKFSPNGAVTLPSEGLGVLDRSVRRLGLGQCASAPARNGYGHSTPSMVCDRLGSADRQISNQPSAAPRRRKEKYKVAAAAARRAGWLAGWLAGWSSRPGCDLKTGTRSLRPCVSTCRALQAGPPLWDQGLPHLEAWRAARIFRQRGSQTSANLTRCRVYPSRLPALT